MDFTSELLNWYKKNKRSLPWRETIDPYKIWISEIILQQTRVAQGIDYYFRFVEAFPDLLALAESPEEKVLKLWQGLGYYSRARNLHFTAKWIAQHHKGHFPESYQEILKLKGIGTYTAAAIASIAFREKVAVVDGNVMRFLSRYFGIADDIGKNSTKRFFFGTANELMPNANPAEFNQALMEFGALQCTPRKPQCNDCPFVLSCFAFTNQQIETLPVKGKKIATTNRYFTYFFIEEDHHFFLKKRTAKDIWQNMYDFPLLEAQQAENPDQFLSPAKLSAFILAKNLTITRISDEIIHILSHQKLHIRFISLQVNGLDKPENWLKIFPDQLSAFPLPKPIEHFLDQLFKKN